jgi:hypothetical protein
VKLTFAVQPAGARATVSLAGLPLGKVGEVLRCDKPIEVVVDARGYQSQTVSIVPDRDQVVTIRLVRKPAAPAHRPRPDEAPGNDSIFRMP